MTREPLDLRLAPAAIAAWLAAALGLGWTPGRALAAAAALLVLGAALLWLPLPGVYGGGGRGRSRFVRSSAAAVVVASAALAVAGLRAGSVQSGPVPDLARQGAFVTLDGVVTSDPVRREGQFAPYVVTRLNVRTVTGRGEATRVRSPILVIGDQSWLRVRFGDAVSASGTLRTANGPDLAGLLLSKDSPQVIGRASWIYRGVSAVRAGLVEASSVLPAAERSLVPALVDGDDSLMPTDVAEDFHTTGLTHLLAVSGSNLTLVLAFALFAARWCGIRAYGLTWVGLFTVVFFVLLARPEPSVLRAAAMGVVALAGLSAGGRRRGVRALSVAVTILLLFDPWLARSVGFLLSSLATAGILLLAPVWRDAMAQWMPRALAEAFAVPLAAQVVCTPAIAAISSQVSLVAVMANVAAAPAVGPTTVLGLLAGLAAVVSESGGHLLGYAAGLPAWWIVTVATSGARLAGASLAWPAGTLALLALAGMCIALIAVMRSLLSRPLACLAVFALLAVAILVPVGRWGWPPEGWLLVACDVGQGDGIVLNAGHNVAVVVDAGPDPDLIDACLRRLHIDTVAVVVLTHFHADHVNGLPGVLTGRQVAEIETSPLPEPPDRATAVAAWAADAAVPQTVAVTGERRSVGQLAWQVLGPIRNTSTQPDASSEEGSAPNNASVIMAVDVQGYRILLSGDAEPEEETDILRSGAELTADVFKVAHHGSANQEADFVLGTAAPLALISVGAENDYGHPAAETLALLSQLGAHVYRTDLDGDIAVVTRGGQLAVVTSR